ncbi:5-bromo-4-chloroindolyl phosphate hydrolase [Devosia insulae DS-56]|uniref:5-bromo-4-chloroindolyl phosphate hydrolase n=1 Tax=Devosia insulae DS-56 TaxID=1116389 RepID=A0A1E5XWA1_9HYPH|nr:5-bromo-4-chloroindolyl phosphate hydrolysis family protein [Devosia insulae]OEO32859.1 5-bromo-4-chloroindolyl phosphate hydrolase [Devosia insulae DS-56]
MLRWFGNDLNWIVAGLVAAALVAGLSILGGVPFLIAVIIGGLVFAGLVFLLTPRQLFDGVDEKTIGKGQLAYARDLLIEAAAPRQQLELAAEAIDDPEVRLRARHLAEISADVVGKVEANPASATAVRRFLSYYLPRAAEIADGYRLLEQKRNPDTQRLTEINAVMIKLEDAFVHYADGLVDAELGTLDVDLKLIQASLKEDLGR